MFILVGHLQLATCNTIIALICHRYYMTNQLTDKSDVYAFGIFLLELTCARHPFIQQLPEDQRRLDQWVCAKNLFIRWVLLSLSSFRPITEGRQLIAETRTVMPIHFCDYFQHHIIMHTNIHLDWSWCSQTWLISVCYNHARWGLTWKGAL